MKHDIRIIQLAKWQIPKTNSVMNYERKDTYLSIGHFDLINVKKVDVEKNMSEDIHPLLASYNTSHRHFEKEKSQNDAPSLEDYTIQELIIFTDIDENEFGQKRIDEFWESDSLIVFMSLIHIDNESCIPDIINKLKECFGCKKYLYYFSFDYSGIVLLAKDMGLREYLELMFGLNYSNKNCKKLIRDSYSFYGFHKKKLREYFNAFENKNKLRQILNGNELLLNGNELLLNEEVFSVSVNIGIQNYNVYQEFLEKIREVTPNIKDYGLFGRHDISLVNEEANLLWLIYIQYLLDEFTQENEDHPKDFLFSTHETFIKLLCKKCLEDTEISESNSFFINVQQELDMLCNTFFEKLDEDLYNGEYRIPVQAVKFSILSILRNRFAEDFVLCMYDSFREFLRYLIDKMSEKNDDVEKFAECFNNYFRGLNSLVNSAMHSERQFIQATAFNAIIYDIPSKIMAFYVAVIDEMKLLIRSEEDQKYTFLLTPSFSNEISVKIISYSEERPPHDRILMVSINERSLYNPKGVIRRMAHEIAHFVGDKLRNRQSRKKHIKLSIIYIIISHIMYRVFLVTDDIWDLIDSIEEILANDVRFSDNGYNYSEDLYKILPDMAKEFFYNPDIGQCLWTYIKRSLDYYLGNIISDSQKDEEDYNLIKDGKEGIFEYLSHLTLWSAGILARVDENSINGTKFTESEKQVLTNLIFNDIKQELFYINRDREKLLAQGQVSQSMITRFGNKILNDKALGEYIKPLINAYSETFSDLQMVLLTGISRIEYLESFIKDEKMDIERLSYRLDDISRISMVIFSLQLIGLWDAPEDEDNEPEIELRKVQEQIQKQINILKYNISDKSKKKIISLCSNITNETNSKIGVDNRNEENLKNIGYMLSVNNAGMSTGEGQYNNMSFYINENLLIYLLECINESAKQYKAKTQEIKTLRETIKTISEFNDVSKAFSEMCNEIEHYKKKLFD